MAKNDNSRLSNGGEEIGMTDAQYKGMLLDQQRVWLEVLDLVKHEEYAKAIEKVEQELVVINEKLKF